MPPPNAEVLLLFEPKVLIPFPKAEVLFPNPVFPKTDEFEVPNPVFPKEDEFLFPNKDVFELANADVLYELLPKALKEEVLLLLPNVELLPKLPLPKAEVPLLLFPKPELFPKVELPKLELPKTDELLLPNPEFPNVVFDEFPNPELPKADVLLFPNIDLLLLLLPNVLEVFPKEKDVLPNMIIIIIIYFIFYILYIIIKKLFYNKLKI